LTLSKQENGEGLFRETAEGNRANKLNAREKKNKTQIINGKGEHWGVWGKEKDRNRRTKKNRKKNTSYHITFKTDLKKKGKENSAKTQKKKDFWDFPSAENPGRKPLGKKLKTKAEGKLKKIYPPALYG